MLRYQAMEAYKVGRVNRFCGISTSLRYRVMRVPGLSASIGLTHVPCTPIMLSWMMGDRRGTDGGPTRGGTPMRGTRL